MKGDRLSSHELARLLEDGPDLPVELPNGGGPIESAEVTEYHDRLVVVVLGAYDYTEED